MKKVRNAVWLLILAASVMIAVSLTAGQSALPMTTVYKDQEIRMEVSSQQRNGAVMKNNRFDILIQQANGQPIKAAELEVTYSMPRMFCGTFHAAVQESSSGLYNATAIPVMRGVWQAEIRYRTNQKTIRLIHRFQVI